METRYLLNHPPLNTPFKIICYMRGTNVRLTGKNVLFLQIEYYYLKNQVATSLKDVCDNLWNSATSDQKRNFDSMAQSINLTNERRKRRYFRKHQRQNNFVGDIINGII